MQTDSERRFETALAWYFVAVWGSGFIATKIGLQHAPPFTFLALRYAFGIACLVPVVLVMQPRWPGSWPELGHVVVAGLLMRDASAASLAAITISLIGVTAGTLYQRACCPLVDLRSAALVQFVVTFAVLAPLAWLVESAPVRWSWTLAGSIAFLVIGTSILEVNALHTLMRRGRAARVASLIYLTPIIPVVLEPLMFDVVPTPLSTAGIAVTLLGVALAAWRRPV